MGGGGGGQQQTTSTQIDPNILPYVKDILSQGQQLYQSQTPTFFPGQTYVSPSAATSQALQMAQERATAGSPLVRAAQQEQLATIQGKGVNPFLEGALSQANRLSTQAFQEGMRGLESKASAAGRYGSGAFGQLAGKQEDIFARALAEQNAQAYANSAEQERQRQMQAVQQAPSMAQADYADIQRLLTVGGAREQQSAAELQDAINRYNFEQNLPQMKLSQFANLFSSVPQGGTVTQTATPQGGK